MRSRDPTRDRRDLMPGPKVFGIGFNKTGTTSFSEACRILGLRVAPQPPAVRMIEPVFVRRDLSGLAAWCEDYDAFQDVPFSLPGVFRLLDQAFPGSRFVLTMRRSPEEWLDSFRRFTFKLYREHHGVEPTLEAMDRLPVGTDFVVPKVHRWVFDAERVGLFSPRHYMAVYEEHAREVRSHFQDRAEALLELEIGSRDAFERLARFLGRTPPGGPMPHLNRSG